MLSPSDCPAATSLPTDALQAAASEAAAAGEDEGEAVDKVLSAEARDLPSARAVVRVLFTRYAVEL